MTTEHKILLLADRGTFTAGELSEILGQSVAKKVSLMILDGVMSSIVHPGDYLSPTERGLDRLDELDGRLA